MTSDDQGPHLPKPQRLRRVADLIRREPVASQEDLADPLASGTLEGGMLPKLQACADAVDAGEGSAHILDGRLPHAVLVELFTDEGVGTMICAPHRSAA